MRYSIKFGFARISSTFCRRKVFGSPEKVGYYANMQRERPAFSMLRKHQNAYRTYKANQLNSFGYSSSLLYCCVLEFFLGHSLFLPACTSTVRRVHTVQYTVQCFVETIFMFNIPVFFEEKEEEEVEVSND